MSALTVIHVSGNTYRPDNVTSIGLANRGTIAHKVVVGKAKMNKLFFDSSVASLSTPAKLRMGYLPPAVERN
jgi:hypothetical protein